MAKFNFRDEIGQVDVDQAIKLMDFSFRTLQNIGNPDGNVRREKRENEARTQSDMMSQIMNDIRTLFVASQAKQINTAEIFRRLSR